MRLPIPQDWDGESWCRWSVCWPDSENWRGILRGFLTLPQRGWTWDEKSGNLLDTIAVGREIFELNLPLNGVIMACNDTELVASFNDIALALRYLADRQFAKPCCGTGGTIGVTAGLQGTVIQPAGGTTIPIYGDSPPYELPEGLTFPPEFPDLESFELHKCSIANAIFDGVLHTVEAFAGITGVQITTLAIVIGFAIAGTIVLGPAGLVIMVSTLAGLFGFMAMFVSVRTEMIARREEFVCAMYGSESVTVAISVLADLLDLVILAIPAGGAIAAGIKTVLLLLFNADTLNQMYNSGVDYFYPDADCSSCFGCSFELLSGEADPGVVMEGGTITSTIHPASELQGIFIDYTCDMYLEFTNFVGVRTDDNPDYFRLMLNAEIVYEASSNFPPVGWFCCDQIQFGWNDVGFPFSFDLAVDEEGCPEL